MTHPSTRQNLQFADFWAQRYATPGQYFLTKYFSLRLGSVFAFLAYRAGMGANAVTILGLFFMLLASLFLGLAAGSASNALAALVLFQLGFALDCADGQLARATGKAGLFGAWLDNACDHTRYIALVIALGATLLAAGIPSQVVAGVLFLLGSSLVVHLHTVYTLKGGTYKPHGLRGIGDLLKWMVRSLSDTPFFLLAICLLVPVPELLVVYLLLMGAMNFAQAIALAWLRIR